MVFIAKTLDSKTQYERHFKNWNIRKNLTRTDWVALDSRIKKRKKSGKDSSVYKKGILIPQKRINKETSRHFPTTQERYGQGNINHNF
jgi:hypothetical protein